MSVKFTKTGQGSEANDESLLFEFLDHELPEKIDLDYENDLVTTKYVGSLQSSQHNGVFLQPVDFEGEFHGDMVDKDGNLITAKERFDQLARLQGRVVKLWIEGIKQIVIIKKLKMIIENYASVKYNISLQPHDLQVAIAPTKVEVFKQKAFILSETNASAVTPLQKGIGEPDLNNHDLGNALPIPILDENIIAKNIKTNATIKDLKESISKSQKTQTMDLAHIQKMQKEGVKDFSELQRFQNEYGAEGKSIEQKEIQVLDLQKSTPSLNLNKKSAFSSITTNKKER